MQRSGACRPRSAGQARHGCPQFAHLEVDRVALRRRDAGVPEDLLERYQVLRRREVARCDAWFAAPGEVRPVRQGVRLRRLRWRSLSQDGVYNNREHEDAGGLMGVN